MMMKALPAPTPTAMAVVLVDDVMVEDVDARRVVFRTV
jgi:hypothetical protein